MTEKIYHISDKEIEILAHRLLPGIKKFFANEEIRKEFEKWRAEKEHNNQKVGHIK